MGKQRIAFLTLHGMGETKPKYADQLRASLIDKLNADGHDDWGYLIFNSIYYQEPLQRNQEAYISDINGKIDWSNSRKRFFYAFSDPVSLEVRKEQANSPYEVCQRTILNSIDGCLTRIYELNNTLPPVVILAQSLGGQVISNYIWDAQRQQVARRHPSSGIWKNGGPTDVAMGGTRDQFRRLKSLRCLITTGCNIPLFLGGNPNPQAINSSTLKSNFEWLNYYDSDDILGWPLADLSQSYEEIVEDIKIQSGPAFIRETPLSHGQYWNTDEFQEQLVRKLRAIIREG